jgi:hypothetical protein
MGRGVAGQTGIRAMPAGFDFTYMFWYMMRFVGRCPFSWSALDIKTLAFALTGLPYRKNIKPRSRSTGSTNTRTRMSRWTTRSSRARSFATCSRICARPGGHAGSGKDGDGSGQNAAEEPAN